MDSTGRSMDGNSARGGSQLVKLSSLASEYISTSRCKPRVNEKVLLGTRVDYHFSLKQVPRKCLFSLMHHPASLGSASSSIHLANTKRSFSLYFASCRLDDVPRLETSLPHKICQMYVLRDRGGRPAKYAGFETTMD
jgi:hypothetical protein